MTTEAEKHQSLEVQLCGQVFTATAVGEVARAAVKRDRKSRQSVNAWILDKETPLRDMWQAMADEVSARLQAAKPAEH